MVQYLYYFEYIHKFTCSLGTKLNSPKFYRIDLSESKIFEEKLFVTKKNVYVLWPLITVLYVF